MAFGNRFGRKQEFALHFSGHPTVAQAAILAKTASLPASFETSPPTPRPIAPRGEPRRGGFHGPVGLRVEPAISPAADREHRCERPGGGSGRRKAPRVAERGGDRQGRDRARLVALPPAGRSGGNGENAARLGSGGEAARRGPPH